MNDFKVSTSDIRPPAPSSGPVPDLATLHKEIERAHLRIDYATNCVEELLERFDRHIEKEKLVLDAHRGEIDTLREMVATLWSKVMSGHEDFLRQVDGILHPKKPKQE